MRKNIKIRSTNFDLALGNVNKNKETIKNLVKKADEDGVNILSLPELSLTGASLYDAYWDLSEICEDAIMDLIDFSKDYKVLFSVGFPFKYNKKIYNAIALIINGSLTSLTTKKNLSAIEKNAFSTDMADDDFLNAFNSFPDINLDGYTIDGLAIDVTIGEDELMTIARSLEYKAKAEYRHDIILNPCAEVKIALNEEDIINRVKFLSKDVTYVHTSSGIGESSTDFLYGGLNIIANDSKIISHASNAPIDYIGKYYINTNEDSLFKDTSIKEANKSEKFPYLPDYEKEEQYVNDVLDIGATGLISRMKHIGIKDVFLGVSGGLDSTMALLSICHAYKKEKWEYSGIHCYTMPAFATSDRTKSNAYKLCKALGLELEEINISEAVSIHLKDIGHDGKRADTAYENAQARERTQVLFDLANMKNGIVIGTGDLSENMQGFATFSGDQMSNYSLNASLMKTEIRYIVGAIAEKTDNLKLKNVLNDILDTPISPELINQDSKEISQKTEDIIGPYELIDFFIYQHLTKHSKPSEILEDAYSAFGDTYDKETIKKWLVSYFKRFTNSQFKRSTSVDGPNITGRSFSPRAGYKIPSDMSYISYIEQLDEKEK